MSRRPITITVANAKGGIGKTTTVACLGTAAAKYGTVVAIDADPQRNLATWAKMATAAGDPLPMAVHPLPTADLRSRLPMLTNDADVVVIDTPPGNERIIRAAAETSDVVIIPTPAKLLDVTQMWTMLAMCGVWGTPAVVLRTRVLTSATTFNDGLKTALDKEGIVYFRTSIPERADIARFVGRCPSGPLQSLYAAVCDELMEALTPATV